MIFFAELGKRVFTTEFTESTENLFDFLRDLSVLCT